jgi:hypothetical protein
LIEIELRIVRYIETGREMERVIDENKEGV